MIRKLGAGVLAFTLICALAFAFWQHQQIKRLMAERAGLREQVGEAATQREEMQRLSAQLQASVDASKTDRDELMRLRARSARLRQVEEENAQLKSERQRSASRLSQAKQADALRQQQQTLPTSAAGEPMKFLSLPPGVTDLGVIEVSSGTPTRLDLGDGRECVITTTVLNDGQLQMVVTSESITPDGQTFQTERAMTVPPNRQIGGVTIDGVEIAFTPTLKAK